MRLGWHTALCACALALVGAVAQAQTWRATAIDGGHFVVHSATAGVAVRLLCLAPSPQGRPAMEVEQHEERATDRGFLRLEIGAERIPVTTTDRRNDVVLWADRTGYRLPQLFWNELNSVWEVDLPATDPMWAALSQAGAVILAPGTEQAWQLPVTNLGSAVADVRDGCAQSWAAAQAAPPGTVQIPPQMVAHVTQGCNAPAPIPADAVQAGDLDGDGRPDFVLDWGGIRCPGAMPRPFCGAANCSHEVFLSSRGHANPAVFLGTIVAIVPHRAGGLALRRTGSFSLCGANGEFCAAPLQWDGASFVERP